MVDIFGLSCIRTQVSKRLDNDGAIYAQGCVPIESSAALNFAVKELQTGRVSRKKLQAAANATSERVT